MSDNIATHQEIAQAIKYQVAFGEIIATISASFINMTTTNVDEVITQALREIGQFTGADRSYVVFFPNGDSSVGITHEWCAEGIPSGVEGWQVDQMERVGETYISARLVGAKAILKVPLSGRLLGFMGLESIKQQKEWPKQHMDLLEIVSQLFASAIERCRAEVAVNRIGIQNKTFLDSIPDIMFQVDRSGIILGFKPSEQYPLLLATDEVLGKHINAILPSQAAKAALVGIATTLDTREMQLFEYDLTHDNKIMYFEARVTKAAAEEVLIIVRDISARRQSEACDLSLLNIAVKVQEDQPLDEIINLACERIMAIFGVRLLWVGRKEPDASVKLFIAGRESEEYLQGIILRWNDSSEGQGVTGSAIRTGKFQLMNIEDPRMLLWRERLAKYSVISGAAFPLKAGGSILGALTIYTGDGDFWTKQTLIHLTNFAEQVALAIHLTANRQRLKLLTTGLESAANAIVIANRKGDIQWMNPAYLQLHGYNAAEAMTGNVRFLESCQQSRFFYKTIRRHVSMGRIWHGEIINRRKDGSEYISETTITPVRDEVGEITNFIAIIQNITQRKQAESEMLEARTTIARTERLNALGTMAAGIAHEINQPLNSLKVLADGMLYWYEQGKVSEITEAMDNLQEISKQADRIDAIIKHMRSFIYGSQLDKLVACDINRAVKDSLLLNGSQLLSHNIEVKIDLATDLPLILGNSTQLEQIIINLLINARQALDTVDKPDKQITIITGRENGRAILSISDNGPGISNEIKSKIFNPFYTTKFAGEGMGLGLSIVHSIITSCGGQIKVKDNKQAGGVTFRIEFSINTVTGKEKSL